MTDLSIIIVSFNARAHLLNCLRSLSEAPPVIPHDVTVVDNASTDGSAAAARAQSPPIRVIDQDRNIGFAAANNVGIRATSGELVLLLNNDTIVPAGAIDTLVARLAAHSAAAIAGPRLVDGNGAAELSFGTMMSPFAELRQKVITGLYRRQVSAVTAWVENATRRERFVDWVSGAALLVYRRDAEAAGLLDERYFLYAEDVDFCAAVRARGRGVLFAPASAITHVRGQSRATAPYEMHAAYRRSQIAFYEKHQPHWAPMLKVYLRLKGQLPDVVPPSR
ncbi:MAG: glycosyltransferase family 2 protein [Acidobacteria bacterium]|nr:glycosyltransferase family 2 protein [Acidobacteriota bacterium]MCA1650781.1 glycosyltransferase family 2 protein [Acidobacteriota bacterium]